MKKVFLFVVMIAAAGLFTKHAAAQSKKVVADKIIGQVGLGIIIGVSLYFSNAVTVEREIITPTSAVANSGVIALQKGEHLAKDSNIIVRKINGVERRYVKVKTPWNPELVNTLHSVQLTRIDEDGAVRFDFL